MGTDTLTLAAAVRDRREQLGMTQEQAAAHAGMSLATWRRLESPDGPDRPRRDTVEKLLRGLEINRRFWNSADPAPAILAETDRYEFDRQERPWMTHQWLDVLAATWGAEDSELTPRQAVVMASMIGEEEGAFLSSPTTERDWSLSPVFGLLPPWAQIAVHGNDRWWQLAEDCLKRINAWLYGKECFQAEGLGEEILLDLLLEAAVEYHETYTEDLADDAVKSLPIRDGDTDYELVRETLYQDRDFEYAWRRPCGPDSPFHPYNWWE